MPAYFDSSVLLSLLKNDSQARRAADLWGEYEERISSVLLEIECTIVLRRIAAQFRSQLPQNWLSSCELKLRASLEEASLKEVDGSIVSLIRGEKRLSHCRTLDAIHVATALYFQQASQGDFYLCSFDQKMVEVAKDCGLKTRP